MNAPVFIRIQDDLVNLSHCHRVHVENAKLCFDCMEDVIDIKYQTATEAAKAFEAVQQILTSKNLIVGGVN